MQDQYNLQPGL